ncbi:MAG: alpha-glucosidase C-terminal domain-containing protein [Chloroflexi bacterium]|nr:alpha-glucosidase C-terminal domain-containing protein [Chloroflexota bacterium]
MADLMADQMPNKLETQIAARVPEFVGLSDSIFGALAADEQRLRALISAQEGLVFEYQMTPRDPRPGQPVQVEITAGPAAPVLEVFLHYTLDGSTPQLGAENTRTLPTMRSKVEWNALLSGYVRHFQGELPAQPEGTTVRFLVSGLTQDGTRLWAQDERGQTIFSYTVDWHAVPSWAYESVFYHIFLDRFAPTPGRKFAISERLDAFFGGTLRGILSKLDYLCELGVNALWLSPIYPSPSHHGYDATNFRAIEPRLGTRSDLRALVDEAHRRGMKIVLDFVPNYTSHKHPFFEAAITNPNSPYRDYYCFTEYPNAYQTFSGVPSLPQLNNEHPAARRHVIESAVYWLQEFGIDGFRLSCVCGPSHDFWTDYYAAVKRANPQSLHFGEVVGTPRLLRTYEGVLDGVLDFTWAQNARRLFAYESMNAAAFEQFQNAHEAYFSRRNLARFSFLDDHNMNRFLWIARGDIRRLMLAAACQFTLSAIPIIYYGTEVGLSQRRDIRQGERNIPEEARLPMIWESAQQQRELFEFYKRLIRLRRASSALRNGTRSAWLVDSQNGRYGYLRRASDETMLVALNLLGVPQTFDLPNVGWRDAFTGEPLAPKQRLAPYGFVIGKQG